MAWRVEHDERHYRTAAELQRVVGSRWLVFWGPASRAFWAFRRGGPAPLMLSHPDPNQLYALLRQHTLH